MVYGYTQGQGGIGAHKQALGFDAAASEKLRIEQIQRERKKKQRDDLKAKIQTEEKKLELNTIELRRREIELRRLTADKTRAEAELHDIGLSIQTIDTKISHLHTKDQESEKHIAKLQSDLKEEKRKYDKEAMDLQQLEQQLADLNKRIVDKKKGLHEVGSVIQRLTLEITQSGHQVSGGDREKFHIESEKNYKAKEKDNKERQSLALTDRINHEASEIARIRGENLRIENELKRMKADLSMLN